MREDDTGTLRAIAWLEIFPWLNLYRCLWIACSPRLILLGAAGIVLTMIGWSFFQWFLPPPQPPGTPPAAAIVLEPSSPLDNPGWWTALTELVPPSPTWPSWDDFLFPPAERGSLYQRSPEPVLGTWEQLSRPVRQMFQVPGPTFAEMLFGVLCGVWSMAVWAFFGGAMTRFAAVRLTTREKISAGSMFRFAAARWRQYFFAALGLLLATLALALALGAFGWLLLFGFGVLVAGCVWPVALLVGAALAAVAIGLLFGWPLLWASVSTEGNDGFTAIGNTLPYVYQRPLHYLFYVAVAALFGVLGWLLVSNLAAAVVSLTYWAAGLGGGSQRVEWIMAGDPSLGGMGLAGAWLIRFWCGCVRLLAVGFLYSYFWTAATCIFLLLRRDVDGTEMDEVHRDEEEEEGPGYGLPPLTKDAAGAPVVGETPGPPAGGS